LHAFGSTIVTASHNPAAINGLKWMLGDRPPTPDDVTTLERGANETRAANEAPAAGTMRIVDISASYVAWLQEIFKTYSAARLNIVLDPMWGCWADRAKRYLQAIFPHCVFAAIRDVPDVEFGGCTPDCSRPHELKDLCETVPRHRAHLGIAFDGDGDRVSFVDHEGISLQAEETAWILLHSFGPELAGSGFIYDQKFSDRIPEAARQLGATPLVERSGHAFIRTRMCETNSTFGAEISGHYFYGTLDGGDDGLYTACRMIAHVATSGRQLAQLRRDCPPTYISPDIRISASPKLQTAIVAHVQNKWAGYPQQTIDGVRIDMPNGWALIRKSVTESALTFRFEGHDRIGLDALVQQFCSEIPDLGDTLWKHYLSATQPMA
jgi:phosphomannomutase